MRETGGESAVDAKDFGGDYCGDGETVEDVDEGFPDFEGCATFTLVVEAVYYELELTCGKDGWRGYRG
jgi:hypothetical protein